MSTIKNKIYKITAAIITAALITPVIPAYAEEINDEPIFEEVIEENTIEDVSSAEEETIDNAEDIIEENVREEESNGTLADNDNDVTVSYENYDIETGESIWTKYSKINAVFNQSISRIPEEFTIRDKIRYTNFEICKKKNNDADKYFTVYNKPKTMYNIIMDCNEITPCMGIANMILYTGSKFGCTDMALAHTPDHVHTVYESNGKYYSKELTDLHITEEWLNKEENKKLAEEENINIRNGNAYWTTYYVETIDGKRIPNIDLEELPSNHYFMIETPDTDEIMKKYNSNFVTYMEEHDDDSNYYGAYTFLRDEPIEVTQIYNYTNPDYTNGNEMYDVINYNNYKIYANYKTIYACEYDNDSNDCVPVYSYEDNDIAQILGLRLDGDMLSYIALTYDYPHAVDDWTQDPFIPVYKSINLNNMKCSINNKFTFISNSDIKKITEYGDSLIITENDIDNIDKKFGFIFDHLEDRKTGETILLNTPYIYNKDNTPPNIINVIYRPATSGEVDDIRWYIDSNTLTLLGEGEFTPAKLSDVPWYVNGLGASIEKVTIYDGITKISKNAFTKSITNVKELYIPTSITSNLNDIINFSGAKTNNADVTYAGTKTQWKALCKKSYADDSELKMHFKKSDVRFMNCDYKDMTIDTGSKISLTDPELEDYTFKGWYLDNDYQTAFDTEAPVNGDINLYAKFEVIRKNEDTSSSSVKDDSSSSAKDDETLKDNTSSSSNADDISDVKDDSSSSERKDNDSSSSSNVSDETDTKDSSSSSAKENEQDEKEDKNNEPETVSESNIVTILAKSKSIRADFDVQGKVKFVSSNKKVATVNSKGVLKTKKTGHISIKCMKKEGKVWTEMASREYDIVVPKAHKKITMDAHGSLDLNECIDSGNVKASRWVVKSGDASVDEKGILTTNGVMGKIKVYAYFEGLSKPVKLSVKAI